jgi:type IV pilus assembly protein PilQ
MNCLLRRFWSNYWLLFPLILLFVTTGCATKATTKSEEVEAGPAASESVIHEVTVSEEQTAVVVTIKSDQPLNYSAIKRLFPLGVVLYFPNTSLEGIQETYAPESTLIKSIVASQQIEKEGASRIQINLKDDVQYEVSQEEDKLLVNFTKPAAEKPAAEETAAAAPTEAVIVQTTRRVRYETQRPSPKRVLLKLFNARIPKFEKRPLITTRFKSAVDRVVPVQTPKMGDTALIAMELRQAVPYRVEQKDNGFFVDFEPSTVPPRPLADVEMPKWEQVMRETEAVVTKAAEAPSVKVVSPDTRGVFTGQKISLDFQDADIRNVFRILHEISGKNFIIGEDVRGRVTLKLDKVPWDQVLDLVTRMNRLGVAVEGNIVRIAPLATIQAEREAEKSARESAEQAEPLFTEYISINYSDAAAIQQHLDDVRTERGKVSVDERTNMIILTDVKNAIQRAKVIVKKLDVVTRQVMIEARIVEANTNFSREIGVQWGALYENVWGEGAYSLYGAEPAGGWAVNLPPAGATSGLGFSFARLIGSNSFILEASLQAMETQNAGKIISAPKVLTMDNSTAIIKQGRQIPYQTSEEGTITVTFVDAVLMLEVTPHITMDNRISMKINATKDAPDPGLDVIGQPAILKKEVNTELLVNNGDTIVIGGIITEDTGRGQASVPGLSRIPLLGWLFKSQTKRTLSTELLIFITPTIVELEEVSLQ